MVEDILSEATLRVRSEIFDEAYAVSDSMRSTELEGLPDACWAEALSCVDGDREVLSLDELEGADVVVRGMTCLFASEIKASAPSVAVTDSEGRELL
jgi:hypothetical protein